MGGAGAGARAGAGAGAGAGVRQATTETTHDEARGVEELEATVAEQAGMIAQLEEEADRLGAVTNELSSKSRVDRLVPNPDPNPNPNPSVVRSPHHARVTHTF